MRSVPTGTDLQLGPWVVPGVGDHPWTVQPSAPWLMLRSGEELVDQGWKLHLSAHRGSMPALLAAALPVLAARGVNAKVIGGHSELNQLNDGQFGLTQVGKVLTVYPGDTATAIELAVALDDATRLGIDGPAIVCDARLHPTSSIFYRYGSFRTRRLLGPFGGTVLVIRDGDGRDVPDDRTRPVPDWLDDPFVAAGVARPTVASTTLAGRYALLGTASRSARGPIHPAVDLVDMQPCVAKRALAWSTVDGEGRDARDRLRNEADLLRLLAGRAPVPGVRDLVEDGDDLVLVMDEVKGQPLDQLVRTALLEGTMSPDRIRRLAGRILSAIAALHAAGVVLCDLSARNVMVTEGDEVQLIDFEIAHRLDDEQPRFARSTIGFGSPSQAADEAGTTTADDLFACGSLLWLLVTGRPPNSEPGLSALTRKRALLAAPDADPVLLDLALAGLDRDPSRRPASAAAMVDVLRLPSGVERRLMPSVAPERLAGAADRCRAAVVADIDELLAMDGPPLDLAGGLAGLVVVAATVGQIDGDEACVAAAERGAARLESVEAHDWPLPGLFVGLAGVAVALAHPHLMNDARRSHAADLLDSAASMEAPNHDLILGTAGIIRARQLAGFDATAGCEALGRHVSEVAEADRWSLPGGFTVDADASCFGYADGAAGVADVLCEQFAIDGEQRWLELAHEVVAPMVRAASRRADGAIWWPNVRHGEPALAVWCRGAGGVGIVLAKLGHRELAAECWEAVATTRSIGPSRCHGLAGQIELLLDADRIDDARAMAGLLAAYAPPGMSGPERRAWLPAGLLEGNAGVALALARIRHPEAPSWASRIFGSVAAR